MAKAKTRKRPCTICRRWFMPDPRQIGRQKCCGSPECKRELHRRQCQQWNQKNKAYYRGIYLSKKIQRNKAPPDPSQQKRPKAIPASRIDLGLPKDVVIEITGTDQLIILDYLIEQIIQREAKKPALYPP